MPAVKTKRISTLIESQLPEFISTEYELFSKFITKYYEQQEVQGGALDIINNLQKYADIDYYEQNLLRQHDSLDVSISDNDTTIVLQDATSFPKRNGYIKIDDEIIFYESRTGTTLSGAVRGVSGNTTLGDLYNSSEYTSTDAAPHSSGQRVLNVSNLFLYALVKNFEAQYLGSFPEKYLRGEVDKRTLIKNIQKFYKAKGTTSSIKFVFNTIVAKDNDNKPEVYKPRDFTYKASDADWISVYALKCKVISGDVNSLVGQKIVQEETIEYGYADAVVDNVYADGTSDDEVIYNIVLAPETVNGLFAVSTKTKLLRPVSGTDSTGNRINVSSTVGWGKTGSILLGQETITFEQKTVTQFIIKDRQPSTAVAHAAETPVYRPVTISGGGVTLLTFGIIYNLKPDKTQPYANAGDKVQTSNAGFETNDPKIIDLTTNQVRWVQDVGNAPSVPTLPNIESSLSELTTDVSSIFADDQYYYITSSSYPSHKILDGSQVNKTLLDQKILRLIRKQATRTTETYPTPRRDVGILLNGVPVYSFKDHDSVRFGKLEEIRVDTQGRGYVSPPFVLVDQVPNKARAVLTGQVVESIIVDTEDIFPRTPDITITSGRNASVRAVVTGGKVTSLVIDNAGEYYSSPPIVRIRDKAGRGRFADFTAIVNTDGNITGFDKNAEGNFYNQNTVIVDIIPVGENATGIPLLKEWNLNRYKKLENTLDTENGYVFENYNNVLECGYGYVANPKALRVALGDNINNAGTEPATKTHSPIIGFAYDGNPIYGAFGYSEALNKDSAITRMTSSYSLSGTRSNGPSLTQYPIGTFNNDYIYTHKSGTLDQNNGRFCVTPEFPQGTYAYFITIDSNQVPQYPYVLGENFYSLPVDSNYNSNITQDDIPKAAKKIYSAGMQRNGEGLVATISEVKSGTVDNINVVDSSRNFSINSQVYFDNKGTEGSEAEAIISSVEGRDVTYIECKENKVVKLTTIQNAYLFADDTLNQPSSGASGSIVGTVKNDNVIVLRNVTGTFNDTGTFSANIKTFNILLDQRSSYTKGAILSLTDGVNAPIATGEVLEGTSSQNVVEIKVLSGVWIVDDSYFIQSDDLFNTSGTRIVRLTSLSDGLEPFEVNQSVALVETADTHGLGIGDNVNISINPDDTAKNKIYYLRKRLYQEVTLIPPTNNTAINFTGIGRFEILNGGADYTAGTYTGVALTGGSGTGATATFTVSDAGIVSDVQLQNAGSGYAQGDYIGVADEDLVRSGASQSTARFTLFVGHVGVASGNTLVTVDSADNFAVNDLIKIGKEILKIEAINGNVFTVARGQEGTEDVDHFDGQIVSLYNGRYNFTSNYNIFGTATSGSIQSYDPVTQKIIIVYDYSTLTSNATKVVLSSSFFDSSNPQRLVSVKSAGEVGYKFEFSEDNSTFVPNPNIDLQEFYKYTFDTSHSSLTGTYFDISPSNNFNLITEEKVASAILPGNAGSFTNVKFGYGNRLPDNSYADRVGTDFASFFYFDKKNVVSSDNASFSIITDPLQGVKTINYVTPNRFVYDVPSQPLWDGSGSISYTTTGQFAVGKIDKVNIINLGLNYKKVPIIVGADQSESFRGSATVQFDPTANIITGINITNKGSNYSKPKVLIVDGDGVDATFKIIVRNGEIFSIVVDNPGRGYTFAPEIKIIESDVEAYVESDTIGIPQSISITNNGGAYHLDKTVASTFSSKYILAVKSADVLIGLKIKLKAPSQLTGQAYWNTPTYIGPFTVGEEVTQKHIDDVTGAEIIDAKGIVGSWEGDTLVLTQVTFGEFVYKPNDPFYEGGNYEIYGNGTTTSPGGTTGNPFDYPNRAIVTATPENITSLELPHFRKGEIVTQKVNNIEVSRAKVSEWRDGSNLLKIEDLTGVIREDVPITSIQNEKVSAVPKRVFVSTFKEEIASFYDNLGSYVSDKGRLGVSNQRLTDSDFYQDYSYVVKSKTSITEWRDLIKSTTHPAGFKLFGQVDVEATASTEMPVDMPKADHFSVIQLWDPAKNKITVENTTRVVTQIVQKVENQRIKKAVGSAATSEFLFNEIRAFEISLDQPFDGVLDEKSKSVGTKVFQLRDENGVAFTPYSAKNLIVTLDGVLQDPDVAYTVSGNQITFAVAPLGPGIKDGSSYNGVTFYAKYIAFKGEGASGYNNRYFRKLRNIFQRSGTWIDAANQIERNVDFIINETVGYGEALYPSLDWATKKDDYQQNIREILEAYQHDIRFGGNVKTVLYGQTYADESDYLYIQNNKTESNAIFAYATRLAKLAIRNWDWIDTSVEYIQGSKTITLTSTDDVAIGQFISSGRSFPVGTKIVSIDSATQVTLNNAALANSGTGGGAPVGTTNLSGEVTTNTTIPTTTGAVEPGNQYSIVDGVTVTVPIAFSGTDQASFSWSGLNNGMFFKAGQLIEGNKSYIIDQSIAWAKTNYPSLNWEDPSSTRVSATASVDTLRTLDVGAVNINDAGDGYETAPQLYVFPASDTVVSPTNAIGIGVELSADLELNGYIKSINITNAGSGYSSPPTVTLGGDMAGLEAVATVSGGSVTGITITGYTIGDNSQDRYSNKEITIDGNAEAEIILGKKVGNIWITESGSGFTDGTTMGYIRGIGGSGSNLDAQCRTIKRTTFTVTNPGYGYSPNPTVTLTSSGAGQFLPTATAEIDDEGRVTAVTINSEGSYGYTVTSLTITGFAPGGTYDVQTKCARDIGLIIDSYIFHLQLGGNEKIVTAAQLYYRKNAYPYGESLYHIDGYLTETLATFEYAKDLAIQAMRNQLPFTDPDVLIDSVTPVCAEVESALNTYHDIVDTILTEGKGLVEKTSINPNKQGNWTSTLTYSNYNILPDPLLPYQECNNVISAMDSLYENLEDSIKEDSVTKTLPDFVDGETKEFELYWDDNTEVDTEEDENLFLSLNAVLQRPKLEEDYPLQDAYFIDRTVIPNVIKFDVPPIWDQDLGAKTIQEPTNVEKVVGIGVGNYKRLTIDFNLVDGSKTGPFLILDVEDFTVQNIESNNTLYVFIDGILQREGDSYQVAGPNIFFSKAVKKEMNIDMRYLYGRDVGQVLNIFDFAPDAFFSTGKFVINSTSTFWDSYETYAWMGDKIGSGIHCWQVRPDGTYNVIGKVGNLLRTASTVEFDILKAQNSVVIDNTDIVFAVEGYYDRNTTLASSEFTDTTLTLRKDEMGRKLLRDENGLWSGTILGKTYKSPFLSISNGDLIRVEGEDTFRKIKKLPSETTSKDNRDGEQLSDDIFATVSVEPYNGITRGEGLSIIAEISGGSVTKLTWNQRSYDPLTQPTAYQYFTPPIIEFIPQDGTGGGARAEVIVSKGQVLSVDLIDGGSGYTKAPRVIVARRFDILSEREIGISLINLNIVNQITGFGMLAISEITEISDAGIAGIGSIGTIVVDSPNDIDRVIEAEIQTGIPNVIAGSSDGTMPVDDASQPPTEGAKIIYIEPEPVDIEAGGGALNLQDNVTIVSAEIQDIVTVNSISNVSKVITTTVENLIPNDALSNVNYFENAAYLDLDLDINDSIAYIPDTTKFAPVGLLMIGDEIVKYHRKLSDRFLNLIRGRQGTTPQFWTAGTYLRQIEEVTVVSAAVISVQSESDVRMISAAVSTGEDGIERQRQIEIKSPPEFSVTREALEVVITPPPGGVIDGYEETAFLVDPTAIRAGNTTGGHDGEVDLIDVSDRYFVTKRDLTEVQITNAIFGVAAEYIGNYTTTNAGHRIKHFDGIFDDGAANVSGMTILEVSTYYSALTIRDFTDRAESSYTLAGPIFNLVPPSIQNPVAISSSSSLTSTINVQDTTYFPDAGYLFTNHGGVIQYQSKTPTSFSGCTLFRGSSIVTSGTQMIPFTIT